MKVERLTSEWIRFGFEADNPEHFNWWCNSDLVLDVFCKFEDDWVFAEDLLYLDNTSFPWWGAAGFCKQTKINC